MDLLSENKCFAGTQYRYQHQSAVLDCPMHFSIFVPDVAKDSKVPVLYWLSGLTCTDENFVNKAGAQKAASELGIAIVAPDTSPRGAGIAGEDDDYDFGSGAGFYVDATRSPWDVNYNMYSYITQELPDLVFEHFDADRSRQGITGHSMGGHGALTIGLKNSDVYTSISAFSPICSPLNCPWGEKALGGYLGDDRQHWLQYDAVELIKNGNSSGEILVDQGDADNFLHNQLKPELLEQICAEKDQKLNLRMQPGYDHSYYFIASFIEDHIAFHAARLKE